MNNQPNEYTVNPEAESDFRKLFNDTEPEDEVI